MILLTRMSMIQPLIDQNHSNENNDYLMRNQTHGIFYNEQIRLMMKPELQEKLLVQV